MYRVDTGSQGRQQPSFTRQFGVKTAEADRERLERRQRVAIVHCEHVVTHLPKLEKDLLQTEREGRGQTAGRSSNI